MDDPRRSALDKNLAPLWVDRDSGIELLCGSHAVALDAVYAALAQQHSTCACEYCRSAHASTTISSPEEHATGYHDEIAVCQWCAEKLCRR